MEVKATSLGSSLPVPSVNELARQRLGSLPERYARVDQDPPSLSGDALSFSQVPVVDMHKLVAEDSMDSELELMHRTCKEWGFFQLINHGVRSSLVEKVKLEVQEFFRLPMEKKMKVSQQPGEIEGFGQLFVVSETQKLDWADQVYMSTLPPRMRKPHLFTKLPVSLREAIEEYAAELKDLALKLLDHMAKTLRMDGRDIRELFEEGWQSMRMNHYPPCPQPELAIGLSPHSDTSGLTILLQLNDREGLQIRKDGKWIPVKPLAGSLLVNIGDALQIITNGIYPSIEHRATVNPEHDRFSLATFYSPNLEVEMGPAPSLITPETPPKFRRIAVAEYYKGFFSRELRGKSYLDALKIRDGDCQDN